MKSCLAMALICCFVSGCNTLDSATATSKKPMENNVLYEDVISEGKVACDVISVSLRLHWVEKGTYEGINSPFDCAALIPEDLDGTYFNHESYSLVSLQSWKDFTVEADAIGEAKGLRFIYSMENGNPEWEIKSLN